MKKIIYLNLLILQFLIGIASYASNGILIPEKLLKQAAYEYNLKVTDIVVINSGVMNDVYLITTNNNKKYVLKSFRNSCFNRANEEALLMQILAKNDYLRIRIVDMLPNKHGNYITQINGMIFSLSSYIDGVHPGDALTTAQLDELIKIVKLINTTGRNNGLDLFKHRIIESMGSVDLFFYEAFKQKVINENEYLNILNINHTFFTLLDKYFYKTTIHRDAGKGNIMIDNQGNLYLIDFDGFIIGSPIVELSVLIRGTCFFNECCFGLGFDLERAKVILKHYDISYTNEALYPMDIFNMLLYDIVRCAQASIDQPGLTIHNKKVMFKQTYARILMLQKYKKEFLNMVTIQ